MDVFKEFALNEDRLYSGVWRLIRKGPDGRIDITTCDADSIGNEAAVLVASTDNPAYNRTVEQKKRPHLMKRGVDAEIPEEVRTKIVAEAVAEHIILDWRNFTTQEGAVETMWPYSKQAVVEIWTNPKWSRLKTVMLAMIGDIDVFKADRTLEIVKN